VSASPEVVILYEHPEWQKPLFAALEKRGVRFDAFDLKKAAFDVDATPRAPLYFNQASPSAYLRGNVRAVPLALSFMRSLELGGARVLNGSKAFAMELSKSVQGTLLKTLGIAHPRSLAFNDVETALASWSEWPALLKPEQGGSGARMFLVNEPDDLRRLFQERDDLWWPEQLLLLQERVPTREGQGIVRMEFLGGELLYAMRVISHGSFNLCPSEVCNPVDGEGHCAIPEKKPETPTKPVEFHVFKEVPREAVEAGKRIVQAAGIDVGGIEYVEAPDGRLVFYDINANSNLRAPIAEAWSGEDPFDRVACFLRDQARKA
jgi:glutathione synthase/RimK-type ligase-like ATP-grasp enzyme